MAAKDTTAGEDLVRLEIKDGVATVTLNRPQVLNALNQPLRLRLAEVLAGLASDDSARAIVLQGEGRAFSAGQDQKESAAMDATQAESRIAAYGALYDVIRKLDKPVIAKVRGYAAGAGFQLSLLADLRIAAEGTKVGMTELSVGSVAIMGSALLCSVAGEAAMKRMVLLSDFIPAEEAKALHLVHEVVPEVDLDRRVQEIAAGLASRSPLALALTKRWWREMSAGLFSKVDDAAHRAHAENFASGGLKAGAARFVSGQHD